MRQFTPGDRVRLNQAAVASYVAEFFIPQHGPGPYSVVRVEWLDPHKLNDRQRMEGTLGHPQIVFLDVDPEHGISAALLEWEIEDDFRHRQATRQRNLRPEGHEIG